MLKMSNTNTTRLPQDKDFHREYYQEYLGLKEVQSYSQSLRDETFMSCKQVLEASCPIKLKINYKPLLLLDFISKLLL